MSRISLHLLPIYWNKLPISFPLTFSKSKSWFLLKIWKHYKISNQNFPILLEIKFSQTNNHIKCILQYYNYTNFLCHDAKLYWITFHFWMGTCIQNSNFFIITKSTIICCFIVTKYQAYFYYMDLITCFFVRGEIIKRKFAYLVYCYLNWNIFSA